MSIFGCRFSGVDFEKQICPDGAQPPGSPACVEVTGAKEKAGAQRNHG
jgi:hypothetical protein